MYFFQKAILRWVFIVMNFKHSFKLKNNNLPKNIFLERKLTFLADSLKLIVREWPSEKFSNHGLHCAFHGDSTAIPVLLPRHPSCLLLLPSPPDGFSKPVLFPQDWKSYPHRATWWQPSTEGSRKCRRSKEPGWGFGGLGLLLLKSVKSVWRELLSILFMGFLPMIWSNCFCSAT